MSKRFSTYIDDNSSYTKTKVANRFKSLMATLLSAFIIIGVLAPFGFENLKRNTDVSNAAVVELCSEVNELGPGMKQVNRNNLFVKVPNPDAPGRYWTLQEAFGGSTKYIHYQGEGSGTPSNWLSARDVGEDRGADYPSFADNLDKLKAERKNCPLGFVAAGLGSFATFVPETFAWILTSSVLIPFDTGLICRAPKGTLPAGESCLIDFLSIIGGDPGSGSTVVEGDEGGIIGSLTQGLYMPLLVLVVAVVAVSIFIKGIVKRQFREAIGDLVWMFVAFMLGLAFLLNPSLVARGPMFVSNVLGACIIGGFNGDPCILGGNNAQPTDAKPKLEEGERTSLNACKSGATELMIDEQLSMTLNSMACTIWKAFILQPWSQQTFGRNFDDLDVNNDKISEMISSAGFKPEDFCVNLASSESYTKEIEKDVIRLNSNNNKICNLASYQLFLMTKVETPYSSNEQTTETPDTRWYPLILTLAQDDAIWDYWSGVNWASGGETMISTLSIIAAGFFLVPVSLTAVAYLLLSAVLMAFAPFFFLVGLHNGRGKKIFLGWVEQVLSNIMKYAAVALMLMIGLTLYGTILGSTQSAIIAFLLVCIITVALWIYRTDLLNLFGQINLGGEKAFQKGSERLKQLRDSGTNTIASTAGGAVGSYMAADKTEGGIFNNKELRRTVKASASDGFRRAAKVEVKKMGSSGIMSRGLANTVSQGINQYERVSADNKAALASEANEAASKAKDLAKQETEAKSRLTQAGNAVERNNSALEQFKQGINESLTDLNKLNDTRMDMAHRVAVNMNFPEFEKLQQLENQKRDLTVKREIAIANGDMKAAEQLKVQIESVGKNSDSLKEKLKRDDRQRFDAAENQYGKMQNMYRENTGIDLHAEYGKISNDLIGNRLEGYHKARKAAEISRREYTSAREDHGKVFKEYEEQKELARLLKKEHRDLAAGEILDGKRKRAISDKAARNAEESAGLSMANSNLERQEEDRDLNLSMSDLQISLPEGFGNYSLTDKKPFRDEALRQEFETVDREYKDARMGAQEAREAEAAFTTKDWELSKQIHEVEEEVIKSLGLFSKGLTRKDLYDPATIRDIEDGKNEAAKQKMRRMMALKQERAENHEKMRESFDRRVEQDARESELRGVVTAKQVERHQLEMESSLDSLKKQFGENIADNLTDLHTGTKRGEDARKFIEAQSSVRDKMSNQADVYSDNIDQKREMISDIHQKMESISSEMRQKESERIIALSNGDNAEAEKIQEKLDSLYVTMENSKNERRNALFELDQNSKQYAEITNKIANIDEQAEKAAKVLVEEFASAVSKGKVEGVSDKDTLVARGELYQKNHDNQEFETILRQREADEKKRIDDLEKKLNDRGFQRKLVDDLGKDKAREFLREMKQEIVKSKSNLPEMEKEHDRVINSNNHGYNAELSELNRKEAAALMKEFEKEFGNLEKILSGPAINNKETEDLRQDISKLRTERESVERSIAEMNKRIEDVKDSRKQTNNAAEERDEDARIRDAISAIEKNLSKKLAENADLAEKQANATRKFQSSYRDAVRSENSSNDSGNKDNGNKNENKGNSNGQGSGNNNNGRGNNSNGKNDRNNPGVKDNE